MSPAPSACGVQANIADLGERVELLEHALHETRQRCDALANVIWEVANAASRIWVRPEIPPVPKWPRSPADMTAAEKAEHRAQQDAWQSRRDEVMHSFFVGIDMESAWHLFHDHDLEPHHPEGLPPEDGDTEEFIPFPDAYLFGARRRFADRARVEAEETRTALADAAERAAIRERVVETAEDVAA